MKKILFLLHLLLVNVVIAQNAFELNYRYSIDFGFDKYSHMDVLDNDSIIIKPEKKEVKQLIEFIRDCNNRASKQEFPVYCEFYDSVETICDSSEFASLQYRVDSFYPKDGEDFALKYLKYHYDYNKVGYLRFSQEWHYDIRQHKVNVYINGYCPLFEVFDEEGNFKGNKPMYWRKQQPISSYTKPNSLLNDTSVIWAHNVRFMIPVHPMAKFSSSFWNNRSEINLKMYYNLELPELLFHQALNGQIDIYSPTTGKKISIDELKQKLEMQDTLYLPNIEGEMQVRIVKYPLGLENLSSLLVNQTFIFDPKTLLISSRINSMIVTCKPYEESAPIELFEVRFAN